MLQNSFRIGRIRGIDIGVHYTWLLALGFITWSVAGSLLPSFYPGWDSLTYWLVGVVAALMLFLSVLIHELCHSFVAQSRGQSVHSITLFLFGGVSNIVGEARTPRDEFMVAIVGPVSSLVLALVFWLIDRYLIVGRGPLDAIVWYLTTVNLILGIFNLVPGFPLDGGRVLRSILWALSGSLRASTKWSSLVGQLVGWSLIAYGVWLVLNGQFFEGLWTGFIGWFLNNAAEATRQQSEVMAAFTGVRVGDLMNASPSMARPGMTVEQLVYDYAVRQGIRALPVVDEDGRLLGVVTLTDIREAPQERWRSLTVGDIMTRDPLYLATPNQNAGEALKLMVAHDINQLPVVVSGRLVGMISRADVLRYMQLRDELHLRSARAAGKALPLS